MPPASQSIDTANPHNALAPNITIFTQSGACCSHGDKNDNALKTSFWSPGFCNETLLSCQWALRNPGRPLWWPIVTFWYSWSSTDAASEDLEPPGPPLRWVLYSLFVCCICLLTVWPSYCVILTHLICEKLWLLPPGEPSISYNGQGMMVLLSYICSWAVLLWGQEIRLRLGVPAVSSFRMKPSTATISNNKKKLI